MPAAVRRGLGQWSMPLQKTFRPYDQHTLLLMPPSLHDWVADDGLAAFLNDAVDVLDLSPLLAAHDEPRGKPPYHPALMLKVLLYGYATGVRSSRKLEARCAADVNFMFLAGQARPDHKTISEFRRRHLAVFSALFVEVLQLCQAAGLVKLGWVALDGTKLRANASKHKAMSYGRLAKAEAELEAEVKAILDEAEAIDAAEDEAFGDARGDELPPELARRESRLAKIREAKAALEAAARERTSDPDAVPEPTAQRNFTDPESRIMRSKNDGFVQGWNAQAAVDEAHQIVVACDLNAEPTDTHALPDLVDQVERNIGRRPKRLLADAGYYSDANLDHLENAQVEPFIATRRTKHSDPPPTAPRGRIPYRLSRRERMTRKLSTKTGRRHYSKRKVIVEPVFGQHKECRGFRRVSLRGEANARAEWILINLVHNLAKLFSSGRSGRVLVGRSALGPALSGMAA